MFKPRPHTRKHGWVPRYISYRYDTDDGMLLKAEGGVGMRPKSLLSSRHWTHALALLKRHGRFQLTSD